DSSRATARAASGAAAPVYRGYHRHVRGLCEFLPRHGNAGGTGPRLWIEYPDESRTDRTGKAYAPAGNELLHGQAPLGRSAHGRPTAREYLRRARDRYPKTDAYQRPAATPRRRSAASVSPDGLRFALATSERET